MSNTKKNTPASTPITDTAKLMIDELLNKVNLGRCGLNTGLSTGIKSLDEAIGGIQKKTYTLLFGAEGSGKSVFTTHAFILFPIIEHFYHIENNPEYKTDLKIIYYSLEVDRVNILGKMLCWLIYKDTKVLYSMKYLFSNRLFLIDEATFALVQLYTVKIKKILDEVLTIIDKSMTATEINEEIVEFARSRGAIKLITAPDGTRIRKYIPFNENEHVFIITDTLTNLTVDENIKMNSDKKECDLHSNHCKHTYRNLFHYSVFNITHSNRDIANPMRTKSGELYPSKSDISISSQPARDADIVGCIYAPYELANPNNNLNKFEGYDITRLKHRYRNVGILKSRDGENMLRISLAFYGECGYFAVLPKAMSKLDYEDILSKKVKYQELPNHIEKQKLTSINKYKMDQEEKNNIIT
jgi:hypothetical protein